MPSLLEKAQKSNIKPTGTSTPTVGGSLFQKAKAKNIAPATPVPQPEPEKTIGQKILGGAKKIGKAVIQSEINFGHSIGDAIFANTAADQLGEQAAEGATMQQRVIDRIKQKQAAGEDTSKLLKTLQRVTGKETKLEEIVPSVKKSAKQIIGEGAGVATDIIGFGTLPSTGKTVVKPAATTFVKGAIKGAKEGAKLGGIFGAAQGASRAAQEDKSGTEIVKSTVKGGVAGALTGGAIGGVTGGVGGALNGRAQRKAELRSLMESGEINNAKLAKYRIPEETVTKIDAKRAADEALDAAKAAKKSASTIRKLEVQAIEAADEMEASLPKNLKTDKVAKEALRQGFDDADVAVVRTMSTGDKAKAVRMYELAKKASTNKRVVERPMDIVGETVLEPAKAVSKTLKTYSQKLDIVADGLKGKAVKGQGTIAAGLDDDLAEMGASLGDEGIDFTGSNLEGVGGSSEKAIQNVYNRIKNAKDAYDLHRVKRYIDTNVEYGKRTEGLVGEAANLLKKWRKTIDGTLDTQFPEYNEVNTVLSETIQQLDDFAGAFGKTVNVNDPMAGIRAGSVASRIMGNSPNRGEIIRTINNLQKTAKKYGYKVDEDVVNQVIFADMLEDLFGSQATRSLRGQVSRGMTDAIEGTVDVAQGNVGSAIAKFGKKIIDTPRGINNEAKKSALEALLGIRRAKAAEIVGESSDDILAGLKNAYKNTPNKEGGFVSLGSSPNPKNAILNEAKKYKTAEDFVKAQGTPVYHGSKAAATIEKEGFSLKDLGKGSGYKGTYGAGATFTTNPTRAALYGDVVEATIPKNLKLFKTSDPVTDLFANPKIKDVSPEGLSKTLKKMGYDGVQVGNEIVVFDPSIPKTKSQLIDIWKKANKTKNILKDIGNAYKNIPNKQGGFVSIGSMFGGGKNTAKVKELQRSLDVMQNRKVRLLDKGLSENSPAVKALVKAMKGIEDKVYSLQRE